MTDDHLKKILGERFLKEVYDHADKIGPMHADLKSLAEKLCVVHVYQQETSGRTVRTTGRFEFKKSI